jgi:hypothetical protein
MPWFRALAVLVALGTSACVQANPPELTVTASDDWTRSYPLEPGGDVQVTSRDGSITIEATGGNTVEIVARRTVFARAEQTAREVLPRIVIREEVTPRRVAVRTEPLGGLVIGVRVVVDYTVKAPAAAAVRLRAANGPVTVRGFSGAVAASSVNGPLVAENLSGALELRSVNGNSRVSVASVGTALIDIRATNGNIDLIVPEAAKATIQATATNGGFEVTGLNYQPMGENTPRRFRGRLNDGGSPIELSAVNGRIWLASPTASKPSKPAGQDGPPERPTIDPPRR